MANTFLGNTLVNNDSTKTIAYAEQLKDRNVNYNSYEKITSEIKERFNLDDKFQDKLNNFFLYHYDEFHRFLEEDGDIDGVIDSWKEIQDFLEGLPADTTMWLKTKLAALDNRITAMDIPDGGAYDVSADHVDGQGKYKKYASLSAAIAETEIVPEDRKSGMYIRYIDSTTGKYKFYHYKLEYADTTEGNADFEDEDNWASENLDESPTVNSKNLVTSGAVYAAIATSAETAQQYVDNNALEYTTEQLLTSTQKATALSNLGIAGIDAVPTSGNTTHLITSDAVHTAIDSVAFSTNEKVNTIGIDNTPTPESSNLVTSGGVAEDIKVNGSAFNISEYNAVESTPATYTDLTDALGANGANVPSSYRTGGMSVKFILQLYTVNKTTSTTQPEIGTELQSDPAIAAGEKYKAFDLSAFAPLPASSGDYYVSDGETTPTYTIYTISKNAVANCEYVQKRYMSTATSNNTFVNVSNWQGVDETPTAGSENLVTSGGTKISILESINDLFLLPEASSNQIEGICNFKYFVCKSVSILSKVPRIMVIFNSLETPYRIIIGYNDGTTDSYIGNTKHEDDKFAFEYNWEAHTQNVNLIYDNSKIAITASSYSQAIAGILNDLTSNKPLTEAISKNVVNKCLYDINSNSYESVEVIKRQSVIEEIYVVGVPFGTDEGGPNLQVSQFVLVEYVNLKKLEFLRVGSSSWDIVISKPASFKGTSIEHVTYDERELYLVINWDKDYFYGNNTGIVLSDGCYNLDNNPRIKLYFDWINQSAINTELRNSTLITSYDQYPQSELNSLYQEGVFPQRGVLLVREGPYNYGSYCIPVSSGDSIKLSFDGYVSKFDVNPAAVFVPDIVDNTTYIEIVPALTQEDNPEEVIYPVVNNGYVIVFLYTNSEAVREAIKIYKEVTKTVAQIFDEGIDEIYLSQEVREKLNNQSPVADNKIPSFTKKIICSGSSITWGDGALDASMVKYVDKFLKEIKSTIIKLDKMSFSGTPATITNSLLYEGNGSMISSVNDTIEFDSYGDEIAICQMKRRTTDYGIVEVYADNELIGTFDNKNNISSESEIFTGDSIRTIFLNHPCTFGHEIYINDGVTALSTIVYNKGGMGNTAPSDPTSFDAFVFRATDSNGNPIHGIQFSSALGTITKVEITYNYGNIVAHQRCTVGQTQNEYENESNYGYGSISYDPDAPIGGLSSGLEFRGINREAFFIHKFTTIANRHYTIKLVGGVNPYFAINFATNRYFDLMNAGIGGWEILDLLNKDVCNYTQFFKWFYPDIIFQEAETNDDWKYPTRRIKRSIGEITLAELKELPWLEVHTVTYNDQTEKYAVEMCTGIIDSITYTSLISQDIIGTETQVGDIIRIGNYHGDIKEVTCRKITEVNTVTGEVKWTEPLSLSNILNVETLDDLVGAEINIRDLSVYKTNYEEFIQKVHEITPEATIVVVENGLPMLGARQLWGYDVIHREIVKNSYNTKYLDAREVLRNGQFNTITGAINSRKEVITPNGASSYELTFSGVSNRRSWYGFKVLVNGIDVYGKDCYIQSQYMYRAADDKTGDDLNKTSPYYRTNASNVVPSATRMKLVFYKNIPSVNDTVEVQYSDQIWSNDFAHPTDFGAFLYSQAYLSILDNCM